MDLYFGPRIVPPANVVYVPPISRQWTQARDPLSFFGVVKQGSTITWVKFKNASIMHVMNLITYFGDCSKKWQKNFFFFLATRSIDCIQGNADWNLQIPWFIRKWTLWSCFFKKFYSISNQTEDWRQRLQGKGWIKKILSYCYYLLKNTLITVRAPL